MTGIFEPVDTHLHLTPTRACHPGMLDIEDLTPGRIVRRRDTGDEARHDVAAPERVVSVDPGNGTWVGEYTTGIAKGIPATRHLTDDGLTPYADGMWNAANWIEAADAGRAGLAGHETETSKGDQP